MKHLIRLTALTLFALAVPAVCNANWYNHPVVTSGGVILGWHSTYTDFNGSDFTSANAPGGNSIPAANLRGITQKAPLLPNHKRGGSFQVWNGPNRTVIRGWINVTVTYANDNVTVVSYIWNYTSGSGANQYPTTSW